MAEQLDIEKHDQLIAYLRQTRRIGRDETPTCRTLAGGVSNRTVLVERPSGEAWVLKQALAKLRVKVDWFSDPSRAHREALGLKYLAQLAPPGTITPLVFEDEQQHLLAMEAVPQPHENWKAMLLRGQLDMNHVEQFAGILAAIHGRSLAQKSLQEIFADRSFFESLRLEPYYAYTATRVAGATEFLQRLIADTRARQVCIVHGDFSPKNILVHDGRLILLDHEVIHWGDPAFDIGFGLTHLLSKAHHLRDRRFIDAASRFCQCYGLPLDETAVRHTLGCMLARVAGRSPLEYLDERQRQRQQRIVLKLMNRDVKSLSQLFEQFWQEIDADD